MKMVRYTSLVLFIGMAWFQSADSLIVDKSFYDNGNLKYQRFYKDGKANGRWTHYYENGYIKEGDGAGAFALLAQLQGATCKDLVENCEKSLEELKRPSTA